MGIFCTFRNTQLNISWCSTQFLSLLFFVFKNRKFVKIKKFGEGGLWFVAPNRDPQMKVQMKILTL